MNAQLSAFLAKPKYIVSVNITKLDGTVKYRSYAFYSEECANYAANSWKNNRRAVVTVTPQAA